MPYMSLTLNDCTISQYQTGANADRFDFVPQLTSDPAQPDGGNDISPWTVTHDSGNRANPDTFDCSELTQWASARGDAAQTDTSAVATLLDFEWDGAVQTGGVSVASGDVNGDNSALGDPVTFTFTVRPDSAAPEIAFELGDAANAESAVRKGGWITDVTFERLETGAHALYQDVVS